MYPSSRLGCWLLGRAGTAEEGGRGDERNGMEADGGILLGNGTMPPLGLVAASWARYKHVVPTGRPVASLRKHSRQTVS